MTHQIRCGIIGYGGAFNMGRAHACYVTQTGGLELVAVCDLDATRTQAAQEDFSGIHTFNSIEELLAFPDMDLAVIVLPHNLHAPVAIECLQAGKHVICEKPMCLNVDEATRMIEAARAQDRMLSVFHNRRQDDDYRTLRKIIREDNLLGEIFNIEIWSGGFNRPGSWWRSSKEISGGLFYDWGAHYLDWLLGLVEGPIESVTGHFQKRLWHEVTNEDHVQAVIKFESGCVANLQISTIAHAGKPRWWILGEKGALVDRGGYFEISGSFETAGYRSMLHAPYGSVSEWQAYYANISAHLLNSAELLVKPEQARRVIAVLEAAEISSREGKSVSLLTESGDAQFSRAD